MRNEEWSTVRIRDDAWIRDQEKGLLGHIRPDGDDGYGFNFAKGMFRYAGCVTVVTEANCSAGYYRLRVDGGEFMWQDWMLDPGYRRSCKPVLLEAAPLSAKVAINAMLSGGEVLHTKDGKDCLYDQTRRGFKRYEQYDDGAEYYEYIQRFTLLYRERAGATRIMTRAGAQSWAKSAESAGWVVRYGMGGMWTFPDQLDYDGDLRVYDRARISARQNGVDDSTIQKMTITADAPGEAEA
jgi:hypothetical protein